MKRIYRGRFAPSPTGPLHFGSLVAAVGSYLDAKANGGIWLVRMDDLDQSRTVPGAADIILGSLEKLGMAWDETVVYQSTRSAAYEAALKVLKKRKLIYPCACSRREIADSAVGGLDGPIYPGTCRKGLLAGREFFFDHFTAPDAYFFWCFRRATQFKLDLSAFPNCLAHMERMRARPSVQKVEAYEKEVQAQFARAA
jgi:hypothetical protein